MTYVSGSITSITNPHIAGDTGHVTDHNNLVSAASGHDLLLSSASLLFSSSALLGSASSTISSSAFMSILADETGTGPVVFGTAPTLTGPVNISGDLYVSGSAFLSGSTTIISSSNISIIDPLFYIANGNPANTADVGIVGAFNNGTYQHTGLIRDHLDGIWKLFSNVQTEPTTTVAISSATYDPLRTGGLQINSASNVTSASITSAGFLYAPSAQFTSGASVNSIPIVTTTATQTLTSKTLSGTASIVTITSGSVSGTGLIFLGSTSGSSTIIATAVAGSGSLILPVGTDTLVGASITQTLTNKTLTNPVISTIVNTGSLTLPTVTDTLVARTTTDILTNKSLSSASINAGSFSGTITNSALINGGSFSTASIGSGSFGGTITNGAVINGGSYSTASINAGSFSGTITNTATMSGGTFTLATASALTLSAGTSASAPIKFTSGSNLTIPVAGAMEYDGTAVSLTTNTAASSRGPVAVNLFTSINVNTTLTNIATAQSIFASTNDIITLAANTTYEMEMFFSSSVAGTASVTYTLNLAFATSQTLTSIGYNVLVSQAATTGTLTTASSLWINTNASTAITPTGTSAAYRNVFVKGLVRSGVSGTFTPQVVFSAAPGQTGAIYPNAYLKLTPLGSDTTLNSTAWS